jgi:hypothetical protein
MKTLTDHKTKREFRGCLIYNLYKEKIIKGKSKEIPVQAWRDA